MQSNGTHAFNAYYLGTISRNNNPRYPFRWSTCTGTDIYIGDFSDVKEGMAFQAEYLHVKHFIEDLNHTYEQENSSMTRDQYCDTLKQGWLPMIKRLENKWGKEFVPGDVRMAKNNVEENLGLALTSWPTQQPIILMR